jgi:hypothetical protein
MIPPTLATLILPQPHSSTYFVEVSILALAIVAMSLRSGIACKVPALAALQANDPKAMDLIMSQMGGQNCHVDTVFEDGLIWLA